jgi:hypothetical protein
MSLELGVGSIKGDEERRAWWRRRPACVIIKKSLPLFPLELPALRTTLRKMVLETGPGFFQKGQRPYS